MARRVAVAAAFIKSRMVIIYPSIKDSTLPGMSPETDANRIHLGSIPDRTVSIKDSTLATAVEFIAVGPGSNQSEGSPQPCHDSTRVVPGP